MIPAKPWARRGSALANSRQSTSTYFSGSRAIVKAATSSADRPAARGNPNSEEPEHTEMTAGRTPASSRARAAPTTDASAPLPPVATSARRWPFSPVRRSGVLRGNGCRSSGGRRSKGSGAMARRVSWRKPASSRTPSTTSRVAGDDIEVLPEPEDVENVAEHAASVRSATPSDPEEFVPFADETQPLPFKSGCRPDPLRARCRGRPAPCRPARVPVRSGPRP